MYKPLPESVTIKASGIHNLGLFADQNIQQGTNLGITHIKVDDKIIRTPLGGFINHANEPNCTKVELHANGNEPYRKKWNAEDGFKFRHCRTYILTLTPLLF